MGKDANIEWCDDTVNPTMGCDGCELWVDHPDEEKAVRICYAGLTTGRYAGTNKGFPASFADVTKFPGRTAAAVNRASLVGVKRAARGKHPAKSWLDGLPRLIFVSDMSDALSEAIDFEYLHDEIVRPFSWPRGSRHVGLWLTKRPARMAKFGLWLRQVKGEDWPENLWAGTSITGPKTIGRLADLVQVPCAHRFLSLEPLWGLVDVTPALNGWRCTGCKWEGVDRRIPWDEGDPMCPVCQGTTTLERARLVEWVIAGGQSGGAREFDLRLARSLRDQCADHGTPFFLKQLGSQPFETEHDPKFRSQDTGTPVRLTVSKKGGDWKEWPADLRVRQTPRAAFLGSVAVAVAV